MIEIITLISILLGAIFGILGTATNTKTKEGKLTKWGLIAIIGIILTNTVSLIKAYVDKKKEIASKLKMQEEKAKELEDQNIKYKNTILLQGSILQKSEAAFKTQIEVQAQTKTMNDTLLSSIKLQQGIIDKQRYLNTIMNRSLNPIEPFAVQFSLIIDLPSNYMYKENLDIYKAMINLDSLDMSYGQPRGILKKAGILGSESSSERHLYITDKYKYFDDFKAFEKSYIWMYLIPKEEKRITINGQRSLYNGGFKADIEEIKLNGNEKAFYYCPLATEFGIITTYISNLKKLEVKITTPVSLSYNEGSIKSILDLKDCTLKVAIYNFPFKIEGIKNFQFFFSPNYSIQYPISNSFVSDQDIHEPNKFTTTILQ